MVHKTPLLPLLSLRAFAVKSVSGEKTTLVILLIMSDLYCEQVIPGKGNFDTVFDAQALGFSPTPIHVSSIMW